MDEEKSVKKIYSLGDDKIWVILCTTGIAIAALVYISDPLPLVSSIVTGLFGVAVGKNWP